MPYRYLTLLLLSLPVLAVAQSPLGNWRTVDDDSGKTRSIIRFYERNGKIFGDIAEILDGDAGAICTKCSGPDKDKPVLGLTIVRDLERDGDEWNGGTVFDPEKGASYRLFVWVEDDPDVLFVRGKHWTGLYRTQKWYRQKS